MNDQVQILYIFSIPGSTASAAAQAMNIKDATEKAVILAGVKRFTLPRKRM
ncbi:MAG: hypothetical protein ACI4O7_05940 [Aristaeellaceae bacterium]